MKRKPKINILILEDNPYDAELLLHVVKKGGVSFNYRCVDNKNHFIKALDNAKWDIILADYTMYQFTAADALKILHAKEIDIPFIIISGTIGEEVAVTALKNGASDYYLKGNLQRLVPAIYREIQDYEIKQKFKKNSELIKQNEVKFKTFFENQPDYCYIVSGKGKILNVNKAACKALGRSRKELICSPVQEIFDPGCRKDVQKALQEWQATGKIRNKELVILSKKGKKRDILMSVDSIRDSAGNILYSISVQKDITEIKQHEQEILHLNQVLQAIRNVNQLIIREKNPVRLIQVICENLVKDRSYHCAWIILVNETGNFLHSAVAGNDKANEVFLSNIRQNNFPRCINTLKAKRKKILVIAAKHFSCAECLQAAYNTECGGYVAKLESAGVLYGFMCVLMPFAFLANIKDKTLFMEIVDDVAFALYNITSIGKQMQAELEIRDLAKFPEENPNPVIRVKFNGELLYANAAAKKIGLKKMQHLVTRLYTDILEKVVQDKQPVSYEEQVGDKAFSFTVVPLEHGYINIYGRDISEMKKAETDLNSLAGSSLRFARLGLSSDIFDFLAAEIKAVAGNAVIIINTVDQSNGHFLPRKIKGLGSRLQVRIAEVAGGSPAPLLREYENPGIIRELKTGRLKKVKGGLSELLRASITEAVCRQIEKITGIQELYIIGLFEGHSLFGSAVILSKKSGGVNKELLESLVSQASIYLSRWKMEAALQDAHTEIAGIISSISSLFIGLSCAERITLWNPAAEKLFGLRRDEVKNKSLEEIDLGWNIAVIQNALQECRKKNQPVLLDTILSTVNGSEQRILGLTFNQLKDKRGRITGYLLWGTDITERKNMEIKIMNGQKLEAIGQLAAGIAHEINNPIGYITSNFENLRKYIEAFKAMLLEYRNWMKITGNGQAGTMTDELFGAIKDKEKELKIDYILSDIDQLLADNTNGIDKIAGIVKQLKNFARMSPQGSFSLNDLNKVLQDTVAVSFNRLKYICEVKFNLGEIPPIECNLGELSQVFLNIIINAVQAMESLPKTAKGRITITTRQENDTVICEISDTGPGIPKAVLPEIFNPFYTTKGAGKGTGLGLSISRDIIVKNHHGEITVTTKPGKGSQFTIKLPVIRPKNTDAN